MLYEKALKQSMVYTEIDEDEALEPKKVYNSYLDKRKEIKKKTSFKVEDIFGDVINKANFSQEQTSKPNKFSSQHIVKNNFSIKLILFKPRKEKKKYEPSAPPEYDFFSN